MAFRTSLLSKPLPEPMLANCQSCSNDENWIKIQLFSLLPFENTVYKMLVSLLRPRCDKGTAWWRHQMETFSALLAICAGNSPVNSPHKGQWRGALMFSLISAWINGWVNNREAGDLRGNPPIMTSLWWSSEPALLISLCQCDVYITFHEICTRFMLCCVLLWFGVGRFYQFFSALLHGALHTNHMNHN